MFFRLCVSRTWLLSSIACATAAPPRVAAEAEKRGGELDVASLPDLAVIRSADRLIVTGLAEVPSGSRLQAAYALSDAVARSELAKFLEVRLSALDREYATSRGEIWLSTTSSEIASTLLRGVPLPRRGWIKAGDVLRVASSFEVELSTLDDLLSGAAR